jgi:transcriptional/translational regulatory protein YebC/TACO1
VEFVYQAELIDLLLENGLKSLEEFEKKDIIKKEDSKNFGKESFKNIGYYANIKQLKTALVEKEIKNNLELLFSINKIIDLLEQIEEVGTNAKPI